LGIMENEAGRMNRLVGDLLSLSRVEGDERMRPTDEVDVAVVRGAFVHPLDRAFDARSNPAAVIASRVPLWDLHARTPPPGEEFSSNPPD